MGMVDLEGVQDGRTEIKLLGFDSDMVEQEFVAQRILNVNLDRKEIFVLARTNKQLIELSKLFYERGIRHVIKSEDVGKNVEASEGEVTLATVHSIKGLEAKMVFLIGVDTKNFPCKGSEHPVVEMVKVDDYDKEDEEKRLFYVALSRASDYLYLTYSGKRPSSYVKGLEKYFDNLHPDQTVLEKFKVAKTEKGDLFGRLREWRKEVADKFGVPAYVIFQDRVLEEICSVKPLDKYDLMQISGVGESKLRRFGAEVLKIVNS
jgi:DNA helicase-2/ATP-dependent DNA helicase PcrA